MFSLFSDWHLLQSTVLSTFILQMELVLVTPRLFDPLIYKFNMNIHNNPWVFFYEVEEANNNLKLL